VVALRNEVTANMRMMWTTREKTLEGHLILEGVVSILAVSTSAFFYSK
jgi:hypothetical protein